MPFGQAGKGAQHGSAELWIGRYGIGVVAAVLVFLGAAYFAVALIPQLADWMKVATMFAVSIAATAAGGALAVRRRNGFTTALMGCGAGSLFISILVAHLYFGMIGEAPAFGLVLLWMLLCLALVRVTQSLMLAVVLQLGLAVSVCLGFASSIDADKLWLLVGYQLVASALVVGGNFAFCRCMYRASLVLALALSLVTSLFIWDYCGAFDIQLFSRAPYRPVEFVAAAFAVQFLSATAFAACLVHSVFAGSAVASDERAAGSAVRADETASAAPKPAEELASSGRASLSRAHEPVPPAQGPQSPAWSACNLSGYGITRKRAGMLLAAVVVLWVNAVRIDLHFALCYCARHLHTLGASSGLAYSVGTAAMLVIVAAACAALAAHGRTWGMSAGETPVRPAITLLAWAGAVAALLGSLQVALADDVAPVGFLWAWAVFVAVLGWRHGGQRFVVLTLACLALEATVTCLGLFPGLAEQFGNGGAMAIGAVHVVALSALTGMLLHLLGWKQGNAVAVALVSTALAMAYVSQCMPFSIEPWMLSACGMVCALLWVVLGFAMRHDQLRLCGLVVVLLCAGKLALLDLAGLDSLSRTIAYIGGGLVCFAVSALYNFATRRL